MPDVSGPETLGAVTERALAAYDTLGLLGEDVEDEWTYVTGLVAAWRDHLAATLAGRESDPLDAGSIAAVDAAIEEIGLITDPNRAIDWLSTFPQIVLHAVADRP
jgi:hypothetical protein